MPKNLQARPLSDAELDVLASYDNPAAAVIRNQAWAEERDQQLAALLAAAPEEDVAETAAE